MSEADRPKHYGLRLEQAPQNPSWHNFRFTCEAGVKPLHEKADKQLAAHARYVLMSKFTEEG